jgi:hypothetical protein
MKEKIHTAAARVQTSPRVAGHTLASAAGGASPPSLSSAASAARDASASSASANRSSRASDILLIQYVERVGHGGLDLLGLRAEVPAKSAVACSGGAPQRVQGLSPSLSWPPRPMTASQAPPVTDDSRPNVDVVPKSSAELGGKDPHNMHCPCSHHVMPGRLVRVKLKRLHALVVMQSTFARLWFCPMLAGHPSEGHTYWPVAV